LGFVVREERRGIHPRIPTCDDEHFALEVGEIIGVEIHIRIESMYEGLILRSR
jgi:hypothetical protein